MSKLRLSRRSMIALALLAALIYFGWTQLTRTRGAQRVAFQPAVRACDMVGPLRYCVHRARAGTNGDIVYHLHGRNLDERIWNDDTYFTALLQAQWQAGRAPPPTVVTVSYGGTWLLTPKGKRPESGLLEDFMERLPAIEAKVGAPRRRILLGESMGGLNVLVAALSYPRSFDKAAALCPGVYAVSPFAPFSTIRAGMERTGASPKFAAAIWMMARTYLAGEEEWRRMSPLALIERAGPGFPALYLSNGLYDGYGNYEGTERLARVARLRGVPTEWHPLYGGHCAIDVPSLANFLLN